MPVSGQWRPKNGISFKGIIAMSLKPNILYEAAFIKGNYFVLSKQFFFNFVKSMDNIIVNKINTLIMWYKF